MQLDADGRVIDSEASSSTFVTNSSAPASATTAAAADDLTTDEASNGVAAVDCGSGAETVSLTEGAGEVSADDASLDVELVGDALLDDLDGDGTDDLASAYRCISQDGQGDQVAMSFSLWSGDAGKPKRTAVAVAPIDADWTVALPESPGDGRVGVSVLAPAEETVQVTTTTRPNQPNGATPLTTNDETGTGGTTTEDSAADAALQPLGLSPRLLPEGQKVVRQLLGTVGTDGRLRLISDGPPRAVDGVGSLPLSEFPERLTVSASGLGPLRLGATEAQLNEALALVVSRVEYPSAPECFGPATRVIRVGPMYLGLEQGVLKAVWVTDTALQTTNQTVPIDLALGDGADPAEPGVEAQTTDPSQVAGAAPISVGQQIDTAAPPQELQVQRFGDGWVALSPTAAGNVTVAVEARSPGGVPDTVTGFGVTPTVCLASDFALEGSGT